MKTYNYIILTVFLFISIETIGQNQSWPSQGAVWYYVNNGTDINCKYIKMYADYDTIVQYHDSVMVAKLMRLQYLDSNLNISRKKLFIDRPIVPNSFYSNLEYKINKFNTQKIEVVFIGRLDKGKGIDDVISIMNKLIQDSRFSCKIYGIYFPDDEYGKKIHNYLENQKVIKYTAISRESYSVQIEDKTASIFKSCDIFLQPYRNISSTVDAPLLIYEAMAALTVIISRNVGELSNNRN